MLERDTYDTREKKQSTTHAKDYIRIQNRHEEGGPASCLVL